MNYDNKIKNKNRKKVLSLAAILFIIGAGASMLTIDEAEASASTIEIAPGYKYTYKPTYTTGLTVTTTIFKQGVNGATNGSWASISSGTLNVDIPSSASPGSTYDIVLRGTTSNPTQTIDIPIKLEIVANTVVSGSHQDIVIGSSVSMIPTANGLGSYTWSVTSGKNLPAGLTLNESTGKVTGTPSSVGKHTINLTATNQYGESENLVVSFNVVPLLDVTNDPASGAIAYVLS